MTMHIRSLIQFSILGLTLAVLSVLAFCMVVPRPASADVSFPFSSVGIASIGRVSLGKSPVIPLSSLSFRNTDTASSGGNTNTPQGQNGTTGMGDATPGVNTVVNNGSTGNTGGNNNGGASAGNGGAGGTGETGGVVRTGVTSSSAGTFNRVNSSVVDIRIGR